LFHPVVRELFEVLRASNVVHADETGWRIDGKNVWAWCISNPRLALFLIDQHRSGEVVRQALGDSLPGVLVTDFYAAYNQIDCRKQNCLVHLLRELERVREELPRYHARKYLDPLKRLLTAARHQSDLAAAAGPLHSCRTCRAGSNYCDHHDLGAAAETHGRRDRAQSARHVNLGVSRLHEPVQVLLSVTRRNPRRSHPRKHDLPAVRMAAHHESDPKIAQRLDEIGIMAQQKACF
jgi:hypothetical protein